MTGLVLSLNAGSSSLKFALFEVGADGALTHALSGEAEATGSGSHLYAKGADDQTLVERRWDKATDQDAFLGEVMDLATSRGGDRQLLAIGHRIVHGGSEFTAPVVIDEAVLEKLDRLSPLAPLHQPHNLAGVRAAMKARPNTPEVACFDTAFHAGQPKVATRVALTRELEARGVRRYGFHGLSYEFISARLEVVDPEIRQGRVIVAHLGNGASLCAMSAGRSLDTTMSFTALDGLVMGTRCGALDPGVLLYLIQELGFSAKDVETLLYSRSGLLGVSGVSADMRTLEASAEPAAREAIELFVYRLAREAGALASSLGGLDGLVFTAGIGEHSAGVRAAACARLSWLGISLDAAANARGEAIISTPSSRVRVRVMATDEERIIAQHSLALVNRP